MTSVVQLIVISERNKMSTLHLRRRMKNCRWSMTSWRARSELLNLTNSSWRIGTRSSVKILGRSRPKQRLSRLKGSSQRRNRGRSSRQHLPLVVSKSSMIQKALKSKEHTQSTVRTLRTTSRVTSTMTRCARTLRHTRRTWRRRMSSCVKPIKEKS